MLKLVIKKSKYFNKTNKKRKKAYKKAFLETYSKLKFIFLGGL